MVLTIRSTAHVSTHLIFSTAYEVDCFCNPNFAEEETEAQAGDVI